MASSAQLATRIGHHTKPKIRVMLVEDSAVVRGMVRRWLDGIAGLEVVETANNGQMAVERVADARADIIILDLEMPVMDGLTALPILLQRAPKAKILISSALSRRNAEISLKALHLGAADYLPKPAFSRDGADARSAFESELVRKVRGLAGLTEGGAAHRGGATQSDDHWTAPPKTGAILKLRRASLVVPEIIVIGSSTGGPAALTRLFEDAKSIFSRVPVLVGQHMPPTFTALLGNKLAKVAGLKGGEARHGAPLVAGHVYVAPGGKHMRINIIDGVPSITLDDGPPINHCRPAVDPLFESVAKIFDARALAIVLTGMGSDGAKGGLQIARRGGTVLVQDEASSVVWGMPGATAALGAATGLYPLTKMGERIARAFVRRGRK